MILSISPLKDADEERDATSRLSMEMTWAWIEEMCWFVSARVGDSAATQVGKHHEREDGSGGWRRQRMEEELDERWRKWRDSTLHSNDWLRGLG